MSNQDLDVKFNSAAQLALETSSPTLPYKKFETISSNKSIVPTKSKYNTDAIFEIDFPEEDIKLLKEAFTLFQTNDDGVHFEELYFTL